MAPSVEIRLLQKARESARAAAEASGSSRRARAPSRKLLEASGVLKYEGAQWMHKEIKGAETRLKKKLREQRKQFGEVGLKAGKVTQGFSVPQQAAGARGGLGVGSDGGGSSLSGEGTGGNHGVGRLLSSKHNWRQLSTSEILQEAGKQRAAEGVASRKRGGQALAEAAESTTGGGPSMKRTWAVSEAIGKMPKRSRLVGKGGGGNNKGHGKNAAEVKDTRSGKPKPWEGGKGDVEQGDGGQGETSNLSKCQHDSCSTPATFGVNGTVRYW